MVAGISIFLIGPIPVSDATSSLHPEYMKDVIAIITPRAKLIERILIALFFCVFHSYFFNCLNK